MPSGGRFPAACLYLYRHRWTWSTTCGHLRTFSFAVAFCVHASPAARLPYSATFRPPLLLPASCRATTCLDTPATRFYVLTAVLLSSACLPAHHVFYLLPLSAFILSLDTLLPLHLLPTDTPATALLCLGSLDSLYCSPLEVVAQFCLTSCLPTGHCTLSTLSTSLVFCFLVASHHCLCRISQVGTIFCWVLPHYTSYHCLYLHTFYLDLWSYLSLDGYYHLPLLPRHSVVTHHSLPPLTISLPVHVLPFILSLPATPPLTFAFYLCHLRERATMPRYLLFLGGRYLLSLLGLLPPPFRVLPVWTIPATLHHAPTLPSSAPCTMLPPAIPSSLLPSSSVWNSFHFSGRFLSPACTDVSPPRSACTLTTCWALLLSLGLPYAHHLHATATARWLLPQVGLPQILRFASLGGYCTSPFLHTCCTGSPLRSAAPATCGSLPYRSAVTATVRCSADFDTRLTCTVLPLGPLRLPDLPFLVCVSGTPLSAYYRYRCLPIHLPGRLHRTCGFCRLPRFLLGPAWATYYHSAFGNTYLLCNTTRLPGAFISSCYGSASSSSLALLGTSLLSPLHNTSYHTPSHCLSLLLHYLYYGRFLLHIYGGSLLAARLACLCLCLL